MATYWPVRKRMSTVWPAVNKSIECRQSGRLGWREVCSKRSESVQMLALECYSRSTGRHAFHWPHSIYHRKSVCCCRYGCLKRLQLTVSKISNKNSSGDEIANVNVPRELPEFAEITQNNNHYAFQGHSRSAIFVTSETSYATSYKWLILTYLLSCTVSEI